MLSERASIYRVKNRLKKYRRISRLSYKDDQVECNGRGGVFHNIIQCFLMTLLSSRAFARVSMSQRVPDVDYSHYGCR